jgi:hypothetical protein
MPEKTGEGREMLFWVFNVAIHCKAGAEVELWFQMWA